MELIKKYEIALKEICTKYSNKYENYINFILLENPEISLKNESCEFEPLIKSNTTISKVIDSVFEKYENIFSEIMEYEKYRDTEEN